MNMSLCDRYREILKRDGEGAADSDPDLAVHAETCATCQETLRQHRLDAVLAELPDYQPSKELINTVIGQAQRPINRLRQPPGTLRLAVAASFALVMVAAIGVSMNLWITLDPDQVASSRDRQPPTIRYEADKAETPEPLADSMTRNRSLPSTDKPQPAVDPQTSTREMARTLAREGALASNSSAPMTVPQPPTPDSSLAPGSAPGSTPGSTPESTLASAEELERIEVTGSRIKRTPIEGQSPKEALEKQDDRWVRDQSPLVADVGGSEEKEESMAGNETVDERIDVLLGEVREAIRNEGAVSPEAQAQFAQSNAAASPPARQAELDVIADGDVANGADLASSGTSERRANGSSREQDREQARTMTVTGRFDALDAGGDFSDLRFQSPTGYWSSPYVPGDPEIRALAARLDRAGDRLPDEQVVPYAKGFDAPEDTALNLHLRSDVSAVDGPTRARLQVGIQAIEHRIGRRPAMNLVALLDIPADAGDDLRIQARALVEALAENRQQGDQFTLVSSRDGVLLNTDEFTYGAVQLALREQFAAPAAGQPLGLAESLTLAYEILAAQRDPSLGLGSSQILLISADSLEATPTVGNLVHRHAVAGSTLSIVPLGQRPDLDQVDALVSTGLGHRRLLVRAGQAQALIEEELASANRAVARSARLSIRLAPDVQLVGILNSQRLAEPEAQRVREIEQSMDQRLQRNRGIVADRGEDEQGIQIVIPNVYTGDGLSILLDVVVDRPGPVAEVTLRYKDLVFLTNNSERAQLGLERGTNQPGPMQRLVEKDLLAHRFTESVRLAARLLAEGDLKLAQAELEALLSLLEQARAQVPDWHQDREIQRDIETLERYLELMRRPVGAALTDSLKYAAWRKTHPARTEQSP